MSHEIICPSLQTLIFGFVVSVPDTVHSMLRSKNHLLCTWISRSSQTAVIFDMCVISFHAVVVFFTDTLIQVGPQRTVLRTLTTNPKIEDANLDNWFLN